jgi:hypothetical protein
VRVIKEYELEMGVNKIQVNGSGNILTAGSHNGKPCVWVEIDNDETGKMGLAFFVVEGDKEVDDMRALNYLGNCESDLGSVCHIFEML